MRLFLTIKSILIFNLVNHISSHGNGAPSSRCGSMAPGHWVNPQETLSPYEILIDKSVISPGDRVNITLNTLPGQQGFKGFFVMVKGAGDEDAGKEGGEEVEDGKNYGVFDLTTSDMQNSQPVNCFNNRNSAMTHAINYVKKKVELFWIAPVLESENGETEKELRVVATFVKDFWTLWTNVEPAGGTRLLLTYTNPHQPSPKFDVIQSPKESQHQQHHQQRISDDLGQAQFKEQVVLPSPQGSELTGTSEVAQLESSSSWNHFERAWNVVLSFFGSK